VSRKRPAVNRRRDEAFLEQAIGLAEKGRGYVSPNPVVGACIVKSNRVVSRACHARFGGPHAEVEAIRKAGRRARGATLYVTLEPCSTHGKTPPCVDAIRRAKISRVVIGTIDPNPNHAGRALTLLRKSGVRVTVGVLKAKCDEQVEAYAKWMRTRKPFVVLKMAQSLDGKIASRTGESRWITGSEARRWVHQLRASCDGILVGKNTVLVDNPNLTVRNGKPSKEPWRIVLDADGSCDPKSNVFRGSGPTILACSEKSFSKVARKFRHSKVTILPLKLHRGRLSVVQLLRRLGALGITSLLVEGGGEVAWSFLEARLVDKVAWIVAPKIFGGRTTKTSVEGIGIRSLDEASTLGNIRTRVLGNDLLMEGYLEPICFQELSNGKGN